MVSCMWQAKSPIIEVLEERLMKAAEDRGSAAAAAADARDTDELEAAQVQCAHFDVDARITTAAKEPCGSVGNVPGGMTTAAPAGSHRCSHRGAVLWSSDVRGTAGCGGGGYGS